MRRFSRNQEKGEQAQSNGSATRRSTSDGQFHAVGHSACHAGERVNLHAQSCKCATSLQMISQCDAATISPVSTRNSNAYTEEIETRNSFRTAAPFPVVHLRLILPHLGNA